MVSATLELVGFFLGVLGLLGSIVATVLPFWEVSVNIGAKMMTMTTTGGSTKGLWMQCVHKLTGAFHCETYNSILMLSSDHQVSRVLMVVSLVLSMLGLVIVVLGMQSTICLQGPVELKKRVTGVGGCILIIAGLMTLVPVSCTANKVIQTFYNLDMLPAPKFELGHCIYLGMVSALFSILGGSVLALSFYQGQWCGRHRGSYPYTVDGADVAVVQNPNVLQMGSIGDSRIYRGIQVKPIRAGYDFTGYV
ncbi:claudin-9-like [Phyllopteryx taeniolatus]|uniref:claudin-9-like n=1 Tax=Phyllopteryx taeniolatus TaxID=161469 RepID=UPI002AD3A60D|nr:claudin-9-like [Phyllopteryx taeniolatus]